VATAWWRQYQARALRRLPGAFDFRGRWSLWFEGSSRAKEQANYNLKYLIAAALLDDQVGPAQLQPARIQAPDAQALLARVESVPMSVSRLVIQRTECPNHDLHQRQADLVKEQLGYEGA